MAKRQKSRTQRWADAVAVAQEALSTLDAAYSGLESALFDLNDLRSEYEEWREGMSENLSGGAVADKLDAILELEFPEDPRGMNFDELERLIGQAEGADLPLGFGRD
jgi:hypothetical protein